MSTMETHDNIGVNCVWHHRLTIATSQTMSSDWSDFHFNWRDLVNCYFIYYHVDSERKKLCFNFWKFVLAGTTVIIYIKQPFISVIQQTPNMIYDRWQHLWSDRLHLAQVIIMELPCSSEQGWNRNGKKKARKCSCHPFQKLAGNSCKCCGCMKEKAVKNVDPRNMHQPLTWYVHVSIAFWLSRIVLIRIGTCG